MNVLLPSLLGHPGLPPVLRVLVPDEHPESFRERADGDIGGVTGQEVVELRITRYDISKSYSVSREIEKGRLTR